MPYLIYMFAVKLPISLMLQLQVKDEWRIITNVTPNKLMNGPSPSS